MPFITFTVIGVDVVMNNINRVLGTELTNVRRNTLNQVGEFMVNQMKANAHVITGRMRNSIRSQPVTENQMLVEVGVPYAFYENKRLGSKAGFGPHNFADIAEQATRNMFGSIVASTYGQMFSSL